MGKLRFIAFIGLGVLWLAMMPTGVRFSGTGTVDFISSAPLETIKAQSEQMKGIVDLAENTFAFTISVKSFEGFNSPLQKEHFNEYYLETEKFPKATFTGKLINADACLTDCKITVFAKGKLTIHGKTKVVTIPIHLERKGSVLNAQSSFDLAIADFDITTPKILESKIASVIQVAVDIDLKEQ
ncbi:MAG: YceI family protein [Bacteroidetes bacterium]|nr:YceI family protein [Bacteroidota bacterium]